MNTPHKDAEKLMAIAQGRQMQIYGNDGTPWVNTNPDRALVAICAGEPCRIKPETVMVNGVECPKPAPESAWRFTVRVSIDGESLGRNLIFATLSDAETVYHALIKPFKECQE